MPSSPEHGDLSAGLAELRNIDVLALVAEAEPMATGIGGSTARVRLRDSDVFVKQLPLTAIEQDDPISTVNWFRLPVSCHYGIGSPGFGVGREIAAHQLTSDWVISGETASFPLLYHWRVLDHRCRTNVAEFDGDAARRKWGSHWPRVRDRVDALTTARRSIVLLLEYVPKTLDAWLREQVAAGDGAAALSAAIQQTGAAAAWMAAHGLHHFDIHPRNILVRADGTLLFTDFGLALHEDFAMDNAERTFFEAHGGYDHDAGISSLLHWTLAECGVSSRMRRREVLRAAAADNEAVELDQVRAVLQDGADLIAQYAAIGLSMTLLFDVLVRSASASTYRGLVE